MVTPIVSEIPRRLEPTVADDFAVALAPTPHAPIVALAPPRASIRRVK